MDLLFGTAFLFSHVMVLMPDRDCSLAVKRIVLVISHVMPRILDFEETTSIP